MGGGCILSASSARRASAARARPSATAARPRRVPTSEWAGAINWENCQLSKLPELSRFRPEIVALTRPKWNHSADPKLWCFAVLRQPRAQILAQPHRPAGATRALERAPLRERGGRRAAPVGAGRARAPPGPGRARPAAPPRRTLTSAAAPLLGAERWRLSMAPASVAGIPAARRDTRRQTVPPPPPPATTAPTRATRSAPNTRASVYPPCTLQLAAIAQRRAPAWQVSESTRARCTRSG